MSFSRGSSDKIEVVCPYCNKKKLKKISAIYETNSIGCGLGWCYYSPQEERFKGSSKAGKMHGNPLEVFKDGVSKGVFKSCSELERQSESVLGVKLFQGNISKYNKLGKEYNGFMFKMM